MSQFYKKCNNFRRKLLLQPGGCTTSAINLQPFPSYEWFVSIIWPRASVWLEHQKNKEVERKAGIFLFFMNGIKRQRNPIFLTRILLWAMQSNINTGVLAKLEQHFVQRLFHTRHFGIFLFLLFLFGYFHATITI